MFKLWSTILKDLRILTRDKVGLIFMFAMPIVLAIVITAVQNSTFELVNDNKIGMLLCNRDSGEAGRQLSEGIEKAGIFKITKTAASETDTAIKQRMQDKDALVSIIIPADFTQKIVARANEIAGKALNDLGMGSDSGKAGTDTLGPITLYYHPVLQESFRQSIRGPLQSAIQLVQSKQILKSLYFSLNETALPPSLESEIVNNQARITEVAVSRNGSRNIPNASQHNVPAWTIFAMFFIVISLGASVVRERVNGSFMRLKTLPTNYLVALLSKQITYVAVTMLQAAVIFAIGAWLFPAMHLPKLNLPADLTGLFIVCLMCGWCAVSFAILIGVLANTQEQANGIGAVSIVLLAAVGGLLVPSFAMPDSFKTVMQLSPLHWCLEAFYGLFLEGGKLSDVLQNILPLFVITIVIQLMIWWRLRSKNLI